jgi:hypothetical protein
VRLITKRTKLSVVMPALVAGIHVLLSFKIKDVDGRAFARRSDLVPSVFDHASARVGGT